MPNEGTIVEITKYETLVYDTPWVKIQMFRNSGECIQLSGSFRTTWADMIIKCQVFVNADTKHFDTILWRNSCVSV